MDSNWTVETVRGKAVGVTQKTKEENSEDFCLDFLHEFGLCAVMRSKGGDMPSYDPCQWGLMTDCPAMKAVCVCVYVCRTCL